MEYQHIIYQSGKVARVIFNRPKYLNAQSYLMLEELDSAFNAAANDPQCGSIVLSGAGRAFSVGHDIGTEEDEAYKDSRDTTRWPSSICRAGLSKCANCTSISPCPGATLPNQP
jgi:enoyl-CoA hydratase